MRSGVNPESGQESPVLVQNLVCTVPGRRQSSLSSCGRSCRCSFEGKRGFLSGSSVTGLHMILRQVFPGSGHMPEKIASDPRKKHSMAVSGFFEPMPDPGLHLRNIGRVENDVDGIFRRRQGLFKVFVDPDAPLPGPLEERMDHRFRTRRQAGPGTPPVHGIFRRSAIRPVPVRSAARKQVS